MLNHKKCLIMDCQTTGITALGNHIIEIAWAIWDGINQKPVIKNFILRLPENALPPQFILQMTGITEEQLTNGL
jgi:DNA polymerase III alpha subunit (gram-positive type)